MTEAKFNPGQLKKARLMRGYTMADLANMTSVSRQSISKYEMGNSTPRGENLFKLASALKFPISFFSKPNSEVPMGAVFFRSQAASTNKLRNMQTIRLDFAAEIVGYISRFIKLPKLNIPTPLEKPVAAITEEDIRQMANSLRTLWALGNGPISDLTNAMEANGIVVAETSMHSNKMDAVSTWANGRPLVALTDNDESAARRRFNLAHELGHILLHSAVENIFELDSTKYKKGLERQAHFFASSLLLPDESFSDFLLSTDISGFLEAKKYWNVSLSALIFKANTLHLLNENQYLYLQKKISRNHWRKTEPFDDQQVKEHPEIFKSALMMLLEAGIISKSQIISDLGFPEEELEAIFGVNFKNSGKISKKPVLKILK